MLTDYKIRRVIRDGKTTKVEYAVYEGEVSAKLESDDGKSPKSVTRYRRSKLLGVQHVEFPGTAEDSAIYAALRGELKKDKSRSPIAEQA